MYIKIPPVYRFWQIGGFLFLYVEVIHMIPQLIHKVLHRANHPKWQKPCKYAVFSAISVKNTGIRNKQLFLILFPCLCLFILIFLFIFLFLGFFGFSKKPLGF